MSQEVATLAGGCFWCLEAVYVRVRGVEKVVSGYSGGHVKDPSYRQVTSGRTGHAEAVQITFDSDVVNYRDLLEIFFTIHDPTQLNRQGNDIGPQYRSAIFTHSEAQKQTAQEVIGELEHDQIYADPIVTEINDFEEFYVAEDYHQNYYENNPLQPYCVAVVRPKVAKLRKKHIDKLKD